MFYRKRRLWDRVWSALPPDVAQRGVRAFHGETCRLVAATPDGSHVGIAARAVLRAPSDGTPGPTEQVDAWLGEPLEGVRRRTAPQSRYAAAHALLARYGYYRALLEDASQDHLVEQPYRDACRRAVHRSAEDLLAELRRAAQEDGIQLDLGQEEP